MPPTPPAPNSPWTGAPPSSDPPRPLRSTRRARPRTYRNSSQMLSERTERNSSMSKETVLITGGTSGIGLATARLLHERGANVLVTGRNPETIRSARSALPDEVAILQADVASLDDTDRVVQHARERFGALTGLFLNAGINKAMPLEAVDESTYDEVFAVNAKGQFFTLQKALPLLADKASVVFTVGIAAVRGLAGATLGGGSKGALLTMVPSLAVELAPRGVRVNAVSPGAI